MFCHYCCVWVFYSVRSSKTPHLCLFCSLVTDLFESPKPPQKLCCKSSWKLGEMIATLLCCQEQCGSPYYLFLWLLFPNTAFRQWASRMRPCSLFMDVSQNKTGTFKLHERWAVFIFLSRWKSMSSGWKYSDVAEAAEPRWFCLVKEGRTAMVKNAGPLPLRFNYKTCLSVLAT